MITEMDIIDKLTDSVTTNVSNVISENLSEIVQTEISRSLAKALSEGAFHRGVSKEVFTGIENIFNEISSFKKSLGTSHPDSDGILNNSASTLDDILNSTEKATLNILDYLDEIQLLMKQARNCRRNGGDPAAQDATLDDVDRVITKIMTELSFQDLTGQKIRLVIRSLKRVEELVYEVYLMAEALRKSKERSPEKDIDELKEEVKELVTDLKGKPELAEQEDVDALLEKYGL